MSVLYTNNASTILASPITSTATSLTVLSGQGAQFPSPVGVDYFMATLQSANTSTREIVQCTARSGDTLTIVRAQEGTTASAFLANDVIELRVTAGEMSGMVPTGALMMWPTATAPANWVLCNGASVSTTTYASLFAVIGYTFGGSGSSFNLPDYRDRMPIGSNSIASLAGTGGSKDAIVVNHTHSITDPGHNHTIPQLNSSINVVYNNNNLYGSGTQNTGTSTTGISINSTGSSGTNANLPPYLGINFIIKV